MPKTLLLADDSVTIQKVVGISFASEDVEIVTVDNGRDAVSKAREVRPDIILADVVMPAMSGYEVCEAVKADPALAHIPVLLLTGTFEAFDEARAAAAGAAGHVAKPFEAQTLVDRVKRLLAAAPVEPAPAATPPAPPPPPAASSRDDAEAFDFFSEPASAPPSARDGELDLDEPDAAFAFGDEDLADALQEPASAPPLSARPARPDATVAILPESPVGPEPAGDEPLDFSFENDPDTFDAPLEPRDLAQTTLLDPAAGSRFDVSSSDLSAEVANLRAPAPPAHTEPTAAARDLELTEPESDEDAAPRSATPPRVPVRPFGVEPQPESRSAPEPTPPQPEAPAPPPPPVAPRVAPWPTPPAARPAPAPAQVPHGDPFESRAAAPVEPGEFADASIEEAAFDAAPSDASFEDASFEEASFEDASFGEARLEHEAFAEEAGDEEPIRDADPLPDIGPGSPALAERPATGSSLSPMMREEIQATLEKIAWDAFGQVTDKIVRQAIERIEQVAWEVVPKLAETLIQEEIRRLKGESEG